ncbi:MAG TPA: hypothetical protein VGI70_20495 [Polyangiales bacterium]
MFAHATAINTQPSATSKAAMGAPWWYASGKLKYAAGLTMTRVVRPGNPTSRWRAMLANSTRACSTVALGASRPTIVIQLASCVTRLSVPCRKAGSSVAGTQTSTLCASMPWKPRSATPATINGSRLRSSMRPIMRLSPPN